MINLKNNKGAITLYILVSLLFFIIAIVNVQANLKIKEDNVELEYQKIKQNYQKDANEVYSKTIEDATIPVESVVINEGESGTIAVGETVTLTATVEPEDATNKTVTWTSSDESIATVDSTGNVTGIKAGIATITAKAEDKTATYELTIYENEVNEVVFTVNGTRYTVEPGTKWGLFITQNNISCPECGDMLSGDLTCMGMCMETKTLTDEFNNNISSSSEIVPGNYFIK